MPARALTVVAALPLLVAAGGVAASATPALAAPAATAASDFYAPPSPLPSGAPGAVIRSRAATVQLGTGAPAVRAWTVMYHSRNNLGTDIPVTGTVLVPTAAWTGAGARPVVGFAVGTQGPGAQCAPSKQFVAGSEYENTSVVQALQKGWAVAVTDYEGYTTGSRATYVVGPSEGHAVLDSIRAAQRLAATGVQKGAPVLLWGYSQGGGASAWATVLQPSYAKELALKADASGGVPADLKAVGDSLNGSVGSAFNLYSLSGFQAEYPSFPLVSNLNAAGKAALADINTQCVSDSLTKYAFVDASTYLKNGETTAHFEARPAVASVIKANSISASAALPKVPVFQYHGLADEIVPYAQDSALHTRWCGKGVSSTFVSLPGEHLSTSAEGAPLAVQFLAARLAGTPVTGACTP